MTLGLRTHPERVILALVVSAWTWMLLHAASSPRFTCCTQRPSASEDAIAWAAMVVAMMLPTTVVSMRDVASRSYRARRLRAVAAYATGYLAPWLLLGLVVVVSRRFGVAHETSVAAGLCVFAAAWVFLPAHERWHRMCHRTIPLYPVGWRADLDAIRQGWANGIPCVAMCWPLMLACTITNHNVVMMFGCTALVFYEKRMFRLRRTPVAVAAVGLALWTLLL